jgi:predicted enzyme related to lactoylglutathione lyase
MHKSRLGTLVIDCKSDDLDSDADFWSDVFGCDVLRRSQPGDENYRLLATAEHEPKVLLQRVTHASRVHLDIETDDIAAEVQRLEQLGAVRVQQVRDWWVMEAPSGHRFCVVPPQRTDFDENANQWE